MAVGILNRALLALITAFAVLGMTDAATAQEAAGDWTGFIEVTPGNRLPLLVHIKRDDAGVLSGTMDVPTQGAQRLPLAEIAGQDARLAFSVPIIGGTFTGEWVTSPTVNGWRGEWKQAGMSWPLALIVAPPPQPLPVDWQLPPDDEIGKLIADRNAPRPGQGIVIGILGPEGQRFVAGGSGSAAKVDRSTLFEIGSISKVFTALLLADMVNKGEVSLDDPAAKYLPAGHHMPERGGRQITLRDLSTHHSGLPRMADDMGPVDSLDGPFWDYGEAKLLAFLDRYQLTRDIGSKWEYSNLGAGLLGYLLARAAHTDYETLLRKRITGPLGMRDTLITLPPREAARLAAPFDRYMRPAKPWNLGLFAGAGGIRSTAADMLVFATAVLDPKSPIAAAMKTALSVRVSGEASVVEQTLGWEVLHPAPGRELLLHDGQTGGFQTILILEPAKGRAVVALSNSQAQPPPDDIALHILIGTPVAPTPPVSPAPSPSTQHIEISLPGAQLDRFVGRYDFGSGFVITVTHEGETLRVLREGIPGAQVLPIFPEAPFAFFWKVVDAQLRFTTDDSGAVTGAEFVQGNTKLPGKRLKP
jgi:D-alanyl-D-alanine-carboxypeptidase/D-alanyl-D-alanine-endopeptidase